MVSRNQRGSVAVSVASAGPAACAAAAGCRGAGLPPLTGWPLARLARPAGPALATGPGPALGLGAALAARPGLLLAGHYRPASRDLIDAVQAVAGWLPVSLQIAAVIWLAVPSAPLAMSVDGSFIAAAICA